MALIILHHNGKYNIYSTVSKKPQYERGLELIELEVEFSLIYGDGYTIFSGDTLKRLHEKGTSSIKYRSLAATIKGNAAGYKESELTVDEFVRRYLS